MLNKCHYILTCQPHCFVVNIQETVFNFVCMHLEILRKRRQLGRNCSRYQIQTAFFSQGPPFPPFVLATTYTTLLCLC